MMEPGGCRSSKHEVHSVMKLTRQQNNTAIQQPVTVSCKIIKSRRTQAHVIPLCFDAGLLTSEQLARMIYKENENGKDTEKV